MMSAATSPPPKLPPHDADPAFRRCAHDVHRLQHPLIRPASRILHRADDAEERIFVAVPLARHALEREVTLARCVADFE